jgi:hypothetical protein
MPEDKMMTVNLEPIDYESRPPVRARRLIAPILARTGFLVFLIILAALVLLLAGFVIFALRQGP